MEFVCTNFADNNCFTFFVINFTMAFSDLGKSHQLVLLQNKRALSTFLPLSTSSNQSRSLEAIYGLFTFGIEKKLIINKVMKGGLAHSILF
ncbi:hypothetical protein BpHYR1_037816 [Brachionus plicatilis]|uniref:Uncharacterized protein n=1 Tax=Brachionus plicatilis TaxID=10195 RepID=A0A3M7QJW4_BRAPC|nr:hypothetical protein BpHYR1_037816 [Brachionus plicatilis]